MTPTERLKVARVPGWDLAAMNASMSVPPLDSTTSPRGRTAEHEKPVPAPAWWISAAVRSVVKIARSESAIGKTKHPASTPSGLPAFVSVGELGRKSRARIIRENASAHRSAVPRW